MVSDITGRYSDFIKEVFVGVYKREPDKKTQWNCKREEIIPWLPKCVKFMRYNDGLRKCRSYIINMSELYISPLLPES